MGGLIFGGQGVSPTLRGQSSNIFALQAGNASLIPAGSWGISSHQGYANLEQYDPISTTWRNVGSLPITGSHLRVESDGVNWRIANRTGCAVGARVTAGGSGYTSAPTVTPSAGSSVWLPIIGGLVGTTVTVTYGGTNYIYPPIVQFAAPPSPGVQANGYATLSGGALSTITVTDQGAGYTSAPVITLTNDPRDSTGAGASASCVLTGSGVVAALLCTDFGNPVTAVPTLSFSGGGGSGAAAIATMLFTATAYTVSGAGSGYSGNVEVSGYGGFTSTAASYTNPTIEQNLISQRRARIAAVVSGGTIVAAGQTVYDGGLFPGVPSMFAIPGPGGSGTVVATIGVSVGGANDVVELFAA